MDDATSIHKQNIGLNPRGLCSIEESTEDRQLSKSKKAGDIRKSGGDGDRLFRYNMAALGIGDHEHSNGEVSSVSYIYCPDELRTASKRHPADRRTEMFLDLPKFVERIVRAERIESVHGKIYPAITDYHSLFFQPALFQPGIPQTVKPQRTIASYHPVTRTIPGRSSF
jgi:hypothetical protein